MKDQVQLHTIFLVFTSELATIEDVQAFIDAMPEIPYWYRVLPNSFFITTSLSVNDFDERFERKFYRRQKGARYFVTRVIPSGSNGRLPKGVWHQIANPSNPRLP